MTFKEQQDALGPFFRKAEKEIQEVATKYGFFIKLRKDMLDTWVFHPEVGEDWKPEQNDWQI